MKKFVLAALILTAAAALTTNTAQARGEHGEHGGVHVFLGLGCCGYYPPGWGYYGYPSYYYVAPPPVAYIPPPVTYVEPAPVYYASPPPQASYEPSIPADQASPTYIDQSGQTCREYQSNAIIGGVTRRTYGTACLQPDGTWRVVK
jgi:hypothetical protein